MEPSHKDKFDAAQLKTSVRRVRAGIERAVLSSPVGPRVSAWRAKQQNDRFSRALTGRHSAVIADSMYRAVVGRPATRQEILEVRRRALEGRPLEQVAQELKETLEGSRRTVQSIKPATRTWLRSQTDGESEFASPRLVFLHLMKVGGTSLSDQLSRWFGAERAWVHLFVDDVALTPAPVLANLRVIAGHLPYASLPLIPPPFQTMVVLRDPFSRTLSHFSHMREVNPHFRDLTLEKFVFDEESSFSGNHQARYLAHDVDLVHAWRTYSPEEKHAAIGGDRFTEHPLQVLFDIGPTELSDDDLLRVAGENLDRIDYVGVTDELDGVSRQVAKMFGLPAQPVERLNVSKPVDRRDIDERVRRRIEERTAVDRELYDLARKRALATKEQP